eukprot:TRINITY_DN49147_c0_g1_i1.p1 TRINITY_DN49147_c0_g1~~TRINITY_DN49147_c0_g1_i1.p1  ORF type:complete len:735 (+),score=150.14 TRINITY_DN49147_c0_g1_i1:80-2206(+)
MVADEDEDGEFSRLSVGELKKRLFWAGATMPSGHLEKADLVSAVRQAEAEKKISDAKNAADKEKESSRQESAKQSAPRVEPRPISFDSLPASKEERELVDLHVLSEAKLKQRIEEAGHEVPDGTCGKHFLVALCRQAIRNPKPVGERRPRPIKLAKAAGSDSAGDEGDGATAVKPYRRPTIGDCVQVVESNLTKRYLPYAVNKVYKIIVDDGGHTPYKLAGLEKQHWFSQADVKWPEKEVEKKQTRKMLPAEAARCSTFDTNQPKEIMIMENKYGCTEGEVKEVLYATSDGANWVLHGGRQVPKAHEGTGWARLNDDPALPPPTAATPPPPPPPPTMPVPAAAPSPVVPSRPVTAPNASERINDDWDDRDPSELSAAELKRRLRLYGEDMLRGLAEKAEFVSALREAIRTRGPPPLQKRRAEPDSVTAEAEMIAQMEEIQRELDSAEAASGDAVLGQTEATEAPSGAAVVASSVASEPERIAEPCANGPASAVAPAVVRAADADVDTTLDATKSRKSKGHEDGVSTVPELVSAAVPPKVGPTSDRPAKRRRVGRGEVLVSVDEDDDVCSVVAPLSAASTVTALKSKTTISVDIDEDVNADDGAEVCAAVVIPVSPPTAVVMTPATSGAAARAARLARREERARLMRSPDLKESLCGSVAVNLSAASAGDSGNTAIDKGNVEGINVEGADNGAARQDGSDGGDAGMTWV